MSEILSQDEIDALLDGVDSGDVDTEPAPAPDGVRRLDLATQERIVRGRLPTLEMINERFARHFRVSLFNMLRRSPELSVVGVESLKFSEYMHKLYVPTNLNLIRIRPLRGTALIVFIGASIGDLLRWMPLSASRSMPSGSSAAGVNSRSCRSSTLRLSRSEGSCRKSKLMMQLRLTG